ncbi:MAG: gliding motility protein GldM [Bacteroidetes bacterium]|nr:gliding motility protein GldM [Bacteroidota bacterium]
MSTSNSSGRQKMINMMYLVLTAMLALNVSAEILKAFHIVETAMVNTGKTIDERNAFIIKKFDAGMKNDPVKTKPQYEKALAAKKIADEAIAKIETLKQELIQNTNGRETDGEYKGQLKGRDNMEKHAYIMVSDQGPKKGKQLKDLINNTRESILKLLPENEQGMIISVHDLKAIDNPDKKPMTWESEMFENTPLAAVVTILQKTQNDIKMTGSEVMEHFSNKIYVDEVSVDRMEAVVSNRSGGVVAVGEPFEAEIFVAASSSSLTPTVTLNGQTLPVVNGKAIYKQTASNGNHDFGGMIEVKKPNGKVERLPFKSSYMGFSGTATISADAMNVIYIGPDNPISVSVPGFPMENVIVSASNANLTNTGTRGKYIVKASENDIRSGITISASVKTSDGRVRPMGNMRFRVMRPAPPELKLGNLTGNKVRRAQLLGVKTLNLSPQETFVFQNVPYRIVKATIGVITKKNGFVPYQVTGEALSSELLTALSQCKAGDMITVYDVISDFKGVRVPVRSSIIMNVEN